MSVDVHMEWAGDSLRIKASTLNGDASAFENPLLAEAGHILR